jgi:hypothetical protein
LPLLWACCAFRRRSASAPLHADDIKSAQQFGVGPQYGATHVYVPEDRLDDFVASFVATFGGCAQRRDG